MRIYTGLDVNSELGDAIHIMPANGSGANSALRDASHLAHSLIAVASQGARLLPALHDYEIEMLRSSFGAVRTSLQGFQWSKWEQRKQLLFSATLSRQCRR